MIKALAIALSLTALLAGAVQADQVTGRSTGLMAQIDGFASEGGLGTTRGGGDGGRGTTTR
ncbi:hypothetical protein [Nioella ostreopsis]|uniref:hypothetical protein n=1 Tax=Nioella ostreopsis TaxID=2448479 RepID=UPI000FD7D8CD|nr:hypothetical protein [Nioella ostreopsis]